MAKENPEIFSKFMRNPAEMKNAPRKNLNETLVEVFAASDPLAGLTKCKCCDGAIARVNKRYYGCARRHCCENKSLLLRKQVEEVLMRDLREKFLGKVADAQENCSIYVSRTSIQTLAFLLGEQ